jgi:hypothetical protein
MATIPGTDRILLFGGENKFKLFNDTWMFDLSDNNWTQLASGPPARRNHTMAPIYGTEFILLYGGYDDSNNFLNDTWTYNVLTNKWTNITTKLAPRARERHAMTFIYNSPNVVMFGGNSDIYYGDLWHYGPVLETVNGDYISVPYNIGTNSTFKSVSWNGNEPEGTNIGIQLRSAQNESDLNDKLFVGPNGSEFEYYNLSGENVWPGHDGDIWIQFKVYLTALGFESPILEDITITFNCWPIVNISSPNNNDIISINKPIFEWEFFDADSTSQSAFQVVIDDNIEFTSINYNSGEQNSANQFWQFPIGTSFTDIPDGKWYWRVKIKDSDGDWNNFCNPIVFCIDTKEPMSTITNPINNKFFTNITKITGTSKDNIDGSGITRVEIKIKCLGDNKYWNGAYWTYQESWVLADGINNWDYNTNDVEWISGERYSIHSRAYDLANNSEIKDNKIIIGIDFSKPTSLVLFPINNSYYNLIPNVDGVATDTGGSGLDMVEICLEMTNNSLIWDGYEWQFDEIWLPVTGTEQWRLSLDTVEWVTDENYAIHSRATDNVGNVELQGGGIAFMYDNMPPVINIFINDDEKYTKSTEVSLSLDAFDSGAMVDKVAYSSDGKKWTSMEDFTMLKEFNLESIEGERYVYYKAIDNANNTAELYDSIILDMTPPTELAIEINNGISLTNSTKINLKLDAKDLISGVAQMSFSNDGLFWSEFEAFSKSKNYTIPPGDGKKTIYFRVDDHAGNIAEPISTSIILNTSEQSNGAEPPEEKKPEDKKGDDSTWLIVGAGVIIIIIVFILLFFLLIKRKKKDEVEQEQQYAAETEKQIQQQLSPQPQQKQYIQPLQPQVQPNVQLQQPQIKPTSLPQQSLQPQQKNCSTCGTSLMYYQQNDKYYCHQCKKYE